MQDGWAKLSTLGRVGTFIHEARHTKGYSHIACTQGPYQGVSLAGCDRNYSYGGSHAVEMEYYARVSVQGVNFHPVYKKMARLMAIARSNFVFNTPVIRGREAVLALSADKKVAHLFDQGKWFSREVPEASDVLGRLKRTSFGAVLFSGVKSFAIDLRQNSGFNDPIEDTYSYYKLMNETKSTKDYEEFDAGVKRHVVKISMTNKMAAYDFPKGEWGDEKTVPFPVLKFMTAVPGQNKAGLYVVAVDGRIFQYILETKRLVSYNGTWDQENIEVITYQKQNLILRQDGKIYIQSAVALKPWLETENRYAGLVTVPVYDAFTVEKD